jgi:urea transport system ATP-binding protein
MIDYIGNPEREPVLYLDGVSVTFDRFKALNGLSFYVDRGEMRAIIGPNGAGKTTMMDIITGKTRPDSGQVIFAGLHDLTRLDETAIANLGVGRKFQKPSVFENQTIFENLELSLKADRKVRSSLFFRLTGQNRDRIDEVLKIIALEGSRNQFAGTLSHGQKQWLEIGMLLMQEPDLLLVDEPVAGMTDAETEQTAILLREISETSSVLVVEHDMEFVRSLNTRVTVLNEGSVLAEGSLDSLQNNQQVIDVYLGR